MRIIVDRPRFQLDVRADSDELLRTDGMAAVEDELKSDEVGRLRDIEGEYDCWHDGWVVGESLAGGTGVVTINSSVKVDKYLD